MERVLGLGSGAWYRRQALLRAGLAAGQKVIDVAVGTGLVARGAARIVGDPALVTGVDPSTGMMAHARLPAGVRLVEGRAEDIPFGGDEFDFLSMGYALRHISDLAAAFGEFHRVLKPGGRLCVLEITRPEGRVSTALLKAYMRVLVPFVGGAFMRSPDTARLWRYYWDTIEACAAPPRVLATLEGCGFREVRREVVLGIFSEYQAVK
jgi:demethylmenaquinone methyltransferase/2-methoxy-6-polyprenyl-1,4-benzoquinol methylase